MKKLTEKQKQILDLIARHVRQRGFPPTMQELADELGIRSKNAIFNNLAALENKGFIQRHGGGAARGITVLHPMGLPHQAQADNIPVLGRIAAGSPILAEQNIERYVAVPDYLTAGGDSYFALRVQGDSMIDAGIFEGDLVIVRSTTQANNGDIVVALTGEEATVKRLMVSGGTMYLKPENPAYDNIPLSQAWSIQGKVVALIREQVA
ncbi:MAG: transcriptional repressor LexA [candidate division KSB1 bacterium]|nr:transcriptional repressor LexA [candidate division KSB1 bacterium]